MSGSISKVNSKLELIHFRRCESDGVKQIAVARGVYKSLLFQMTSLFACINFDRLINKLDLYSNW
jgi:hypothetical protein